MPASTILYRRQSANQFFKTHMKICYLANASCVHTTKWVNYFCKRGHDVEVVSFEAPSGLDVRTVTHVINPILPLGAHYLLRGSAVRRLIDRAKPDIVHAHYGSGYGSLGRLAKFHPFVLSVWGSDVFEFPRKSPFHRELLRKNLSSADRVCSTSYFMATETKRYIPTRAINVTPFGVDCRAFAPRADTGNSADQIVIGTVKKLEPKYGIEYLIRGFAMAAAKYPKSKLRLVIAGDGSLRESLTKLASTLGVGDQTRFLGFVPHEKVPEVLNSFSVFAALSVADSETFGVAVVEASACGLPVVVSSVGGLPEVVRDRETGLIVPPRDQLAAASSFEELIENEAFRRALGAAGRNFVIKHYEWDENASRMERLYESLIGSKQLVQAAPNFAGTR
jgi:L-malate glycosyltransferase